MIVVVTRDYVVMCVATRTVLSYVGFDIRIATDTPPTDIGKMLDTWCVRHVADTHCVRPPNHTIVTQ